MIHWYTCLYPSHCWINLSRTQLVWMILIFYVNNVPNKIKQPPEITNIIDHFIKYPPSFNPFLHHEFLRTHSKSNEKHRNTKSKRIWRITPNVSDYFVNCNNIVAKIIGMRSWVATDFSNYGVVLLLTVRIWFMRFESCFNRIATSGWYYIPRTVCDAHGLSWFVMVWW